MDKTELTIQTYDACAQAFEAQFGSLELYRDSFLPFLQSLQHVPGAKVLDLGCGPGNVARFLLEQNPSLKITGVDLSESMLTLARKNVPGANFILQDIRSLDFPEASFDAVVAAFCMPYLDDEEACAFLSAVSLMLKNGGFVYLSTMQGTGARYETAGFSSGRQLYMHYYKKEMLLDLMGKNALSVVCYKEQNYQEPDGSITKDMIFILEKKEGEK